MNGAIKTLAVVTAFLVSACQTGTDTSRKDAGGRTMHLSQWKSIKPHELVINIADLDGIVILEPQSQIRDNEVLHQRAKFYGGGGLNLEHIQVYYYNLQTTDAMNSRENAKAEADRYYKRRKQRVVYEEERKISSGDRGGWMATIEVKDTGQTCLLARVGFLGDTNKRTPIGEHYDTVVRFRDCSGKRSMDDVEAFLKGMKIVDSEYNLMRFRRPNVSGNPRKPLSEMTIDELADEYNRAR